MAQPTLLFIAPVLKSSGYSVHARRVLDALIDSKIFNISLQAISWAGSSQHWNDDQTKLIIYQQLYSKFKIEHDQGKRQYDIVILMSIANELDHHLSDGKWQAGGYLDQIMAGFKILITAGIETDRISPQWITAINKHCHLVVTPSEFSANTMRNTIYKMQNNQTNEVSELKVQVPVVVVSEGVDTSIFYPGLKENIIELDKTEEDFNFLYVGQFQTDRSWGEERKNTALMIRWFLETFATLNEKEKKPGLILKIHNKNFARYDNDNVKGALTALKKAVQEHLDSKLVGTNKKHILPNIHLLHGSLSDKEMAALYCHPKVKCYMGIGNEGFNLPAIEAAACGLPQIALNYSGHLDFLNLGKFIRIEYDIVKIPEKAVWPGVIEKDSAWAFAKEEDFKRKLRKVYSDYSFPQKWAEELAIKIKEEHDIKKTGKELVTTILDMIEEFHKVQDPKFMMDMYAAQFLQIEPGNKDKKKILYTMPQSAGDVFISTGVVAALKNKYPDSLIFFATQQQYVDILKDNPDIYRVIPWNNFMLNVELCKLLFDDVYTPNVNVQYNFSNWMNEGNKNLLYEELSKACFVDYLPPKIKLEPVDNLPGKYITIHTTPQKGQWGARKYYYWSDIIKNLKNYLPPELKIVQIGFDEDQIDGIDYSFVNKTSWNQFAHIINKSLLHITVDTISAHIASAFNTPMVEIFSNTTKGKTMPWHKNIETYNAFQYECRDRYSCKFPCYKNECVINKQRPCINNIDPTIIWNFALDILLSNKIINPESEGITRGFVYYTPTLGGYITTYNCIKADLPFKESIVSMLGFCDKVVVLDMESTDGTWEELEKLKLENDKQLDIYREPWSDEPGKDGISKTKARMYLSTDFCWQQDADEVVFPEHWGTIKKLVKEFPIDFSLMHLPVVEYWGKNFDVRTSHHPYKERCSRNQFNMYHGIYKHAQVKDEKTNKIHAIENMSDGCSVLDIDTNEFIPHCGFYNQELDVQRKFKTNLFIEKMKTIFKELPTIHHFAYWSIQRKILQEKEIWSEFWSNLYNTEYKNVYFPGKKKEEITNEMILEKAKAVYKLGGKTEKESGPLFKYETKFPDFMHNWTEHINKKCEV